VFFKKTNIKDMASSKKGRKDDNLVIVEHALTSTEHFIERHQKTITIAVIAILVVVGGWLGFRRFIVEPREDEAKSQMFAAELYFEKDSFNLALNGDGNYLGFLDIIDDYGITRTADLAHYYAGISYLNLGDFESAVEHLKKFKLNDKLIRTVAIGAIGDAYMELGQQNKAIDHYLKAARRKPNSFTTPLYLMKAAEIIEKSGSPQKALGYYREIKEKYPESNEGRFIDKYISRAEASL